MDNPVQNEKDFEAGKIEGRANTLIENVYNLKKNLNMSTEEAINALGFLSERQKEIEPFVRKISFLEKVINDESVIKNPFFSFSYEQGYNEGYDSAWTKSELHTLRVAINNLMKNLNLSEEEAMDALGLSVDMRKEMKEKLQEDLDAFYKNFKFML